MKKIISTLAGTIIIIISALIIYGGVFIYQYYAIKSANALLQIQGNQQSQNQQQQTIKQQINIQPKFEQNNNQPISQIVGGACSYYVIDGSCKIVSVAQTPESKQQESSIGYGGFDVEFVFTTKSSLAIPDVAKSILASSKSPHLLLLTNSWYLGPLYLAKYNIKENSIFDCHALVISKGTCSPVVFKFSNVMTSVNGPEG